ncbi:GGDEF domain-containing protein [Oxalobacteraceae bacterium OM1]|nr:GGDEF domain-containing protein [Oxalobacteraceae bacterium OM1]
MDFILPDSALVELEAKLATASRRQRLELLVALAWHSRQRDTRRALDLAKEAEAVMQTVADAEERKQVSARLALVRGEVRWLFGDIDSARDFADAARSQFDALEDPVGCADACWLSSWVASERGDRGRRERELDNAIRHARRAGDARRKTIAELVRLRWLAFEDARAAERSFHERFDIDQLETDPVLATWANDLLGLLASNTSDFALGVEHQIRAHDAALQTGQLHRAVFAIANIGVAFNNLGDHLSALDWLERGLNLSRTAGWPGCIGLCLMQTAEPLRLLGRRDAARAMLNEALDILRPLQHSHNYDLALQYMGDLELDGGDCAVALDTFIRLEERERARPGAGLSLIVQRGKAQALCLLGRPTEALDVATNAVALARERGDAYNEVAALRVLAEIHSMHRLPSPDTRAASGPLHFLEQALALAETIKGYTVPGELLDAVSREYAAAGDIARAYEYALQANQARQKTHSLEATNRAIAMQVFHETERARLLGEHHRQLAEAEARRVELLEQTNTTLEVLGVIGQEITAQLSDAAVFETLNRHVHDLLDVSYFAIYVTDAEGKGLQPEFAVEDGRAIRMRYIALDNPYSDAARCVRERRQIVHNLEPGYAHASHVPGTSRTASVMFAPLAISDRVLGAMSIQSMKRYAYAEREQLIFRTLSAYGAIALDNARAYSRLNETLDALRATQRQLMEKNLELEQAYRQLEEQSLKDPLTGLRNRRFLTEQLDRDVSLTLRRYEDHARHGSPPPVDDDLVFFMIDFDHFKQLNDQHGHPAGDAVLVQLRERLESVFRESDYLVRWGGEEFLAVARGTHRTEAPALAERVRLAIGGAPFLIPGGRTVHKTCSIGFACFPFLPQRPRWANWAQAIEFADKALYMAKHSGRDGWVGLHAAEGFAPQEAFGAVIESLERRLEQGDITVRSRWQVNAG